MNRQLSIPLLPLLIDGSRGRLFALYAPPADSSQEVLLFLPSFAEELNRCRVMVALQARHLAKLGVGCLILDYYGTGDSGGDFADTHWQQWLADAQSAYTWLQQQGHSKIGLWGVRLGAILAAELAGAEPDRYSRLLLWQPVVDGKALMTQFLRIRMAMLLDRGEAKETPQKMRQAFADGQSLEVAGYELNPELVLAVDNKHLSAVAGLSKTLPIDWFEAVFGTPNAPSSASDNVLAEWRQQGVAVNFHPFNGPPFWQLHNRELASALIEKTTRLFAQ